jgi:hypothetical protein
VGDRGGGRREQGEEEGEEGAEESHEKCIKYSRNIADTYAQYVPS